MRYPFRLEDPAAMPPSTMLCMVPLPRFAEEEHH